MLRFRCFASLAVVGALYAAIPAAATTIVPKDCSSATSIADRPLLVLGDTGPCVGFLQHLLIQKDRLDLLSQKYRDPYSFLYRTKDAVIHFQTENHLTPDGKVGAATWQALAIAPSNNAKIPADCRSAKLAICVSMSARKLYLLRGGHIRLMLDVRFGSRFIPHGTDTHIGDTSIIRKVPLDWSVPSKAWMPDSMYFYGGQAIHYSEGFRLQGYFGSSHGCINVRDRKAMDWLFAHTPIGTPVKVYE